MRDGREEQENGNVRKEIWRWGRIKKERKKKIVKRNLEEGQKGRGK